MSLVDWIISNYPAGYGVEISAIGLGILFIIVYDFYHLLFSAVLSWFKR